jgi:putative radical SAM enzyme (TIGR03279 family)
MTNLSEEEFDRILTMRISPLYISVHAWDPLIRAKMMGNPKAASLSAQLKRLSNAGIQMHTQIVLVPGCNDGEILHQTVHQLASLRPHISTIGVVPVGLTRHRITLPPLRVLTPQECKGILDKGHKWQKDFCRQYAKNLVYFADEFYLACGHRIPDPEEYDGFEQLENGIGMLSAFTEDLQILLNGETGTQAPATPAAPVAPATARESTCEAPLSTRHLITGELAAPFLQNCLEQLNNQTPTTQAIRLHPIRNTFFGSGITVAGLVTATDIARQVGNLGGEEFIIPRVMFKADEDIFLDGHTVQWLEKQINGRAIIVDSTAQGFLEALRQ